MEIKHYRRAMYCLIAVILVLGVCLGYLYQRWQDEKFARWTTQLESAMNQRDADHYHELYLDCLSGKSDLPWTGYKSSP